MLIPHSVRAYVHDAAIRRAVNEILKIPARSLLDGLSWEELGRFYRAQLAARQLECEWAVFGLNAWHEIWGGLLDHWVPLTPEEQMEPQHGSGLDLISLKETDDESLWFGRAFRNAGYTYYAALTAAPSIGLRLSMNCSSDARSIRFTELAPAADEFENWTPPLATSLDSSEFHPAELRELASRAVSIADASYSPRRRPSPSPVS